MGDRLRGLEKLPSSMVGEGAYALPSAESLLGRLDQIDLRLRQLEQKQRLPSSSDSYFTTDLLRRATGRSGQQQCKSLSSALQEVHLKGTLMDRLHLLESRILQLSYELDMGCSRGETTTMTKPTTTTAASDEKQEITALCSSRFIGGPSRPNCKSLKGTAVELQDPKSNMKKVKDPKEAMDEAGKRASAMCRNEKRRMERTLIYRKWFPVGC